MELYKNIIITVVAVLVMTSSIYTIFICCQCQKFRKESHVVLPLLMSVFIAGLLTGIFCIIACIVCWAEIQHLTLLLKIEFVLIWLSSYAQYFSLAMLSAIKSFGVLKPFLYIRSVTRNKTLIITFVIWFISLVGAVPMILPIPMGFSQAVQLPSPGPNGDQLGHLFDVLVYPYFLFNIPRLVIFVSSIVLLTVTVKHKLQIKQVTNLGSGEKAERADEVIRAIWSSKGILAISIICIILNVPAMTVAKIPLVKQEPRFYCYWFAVSGTFWYSLCVILTSPSLKNWIKSGGRNKIDAADSI